MNTITTVTSAPIKWFRNSLLLTLVVFSQYLTGRLRITIRSGPAYSVAVHSNLDPHCRRTRQAQTKFHFHNARMIAWKEQTWEIEHVLLYMIVGCTLNPSSESSASLGKGENLSSLMAVVSPRPHHPLPIFELPRVETSQPRGVLHRTVQDYSLWSSALISFAHDRSDIYTV